MSMNEQKQDKTKRSIGDFLALALFGALVCVLASPLVLP